MGQTRRKKINRKRNQTERATEGGTAEQLQSNHIPRNTDLIWDKFLHVYALPFSNQRIDPLNQQRVIRWTIGDIPAYTRSDGIFPKMRSNVMELICRSLQWWHMAYTQSRYLLLYSSLANLGGYIQCLIAHINIALRRGTNYSCIINTTSITGRW